MPLQDLAPSRAPQNRLRGGFGPFGFVRSAWFQDPASDKPVVASLFSIFALLFLLAAPRNAAAADGDFYHVREVKPNVFVWVAEDILDQEGDPQYNRAGNAGFIITRDGVVVVNTTNTPFNARALLYEIRQRTELPVRYVINTNASPDVMLGNEAFEDFKPVILSTPEAALAMRQYQEAFSSRIEGDWKIAASMRGIHPVPPTQTFDKETTLQLGGQQIKLISLGDNISPGDAAVYLPGSKVLFLGNVFENEYIPRIGSANIDHWIETLHQVESWDVDVYVPGHGQPSGKAGVQEFGQFLAWLSGQVRSGLQRSMTLPQIQNSLVPFQKVHWHAPELESEAVAAIYRLLVKQKNQISSSSESANP
jgi:cyclase